MQNDDQNHIKISKPKPRRLFSFDSVKSSSSRRSSSDSSQASPRGPRPVNPFDLSNVQESAGEDDHEATHLRYVTDSQHIPLTRAAPMNPPLGREDRPSRFEPVRPPSFAQIQPSTPRSPPPPPAAAAPARRWDSLRQHVLPPTRPLTPPQRPGSAQSHASGLFPVRSTTPKPSRLARLGFKHVVEGAREMQDDTRKFGQELLRACAIARYGEEASAHSVAGTATGLSAAAGGKRLDYLRRPMSVSSLSLTSSLPTSSSGPSLRFLHQMLVYHSAQPEDNGRRPLPNLPQESQVLSALLCPFLIPNKYPIVRIDEEQLTAVDSFELLSRSWVPVDEAARVERCLWCTKAAASISPCPTRTRILACLRRFIIPGDRNRTLLSTQGFQSLSSGLLLLLVALYRTTIVYESQRSSTYMPDSHAIAPASFEKPPHPDIHLVQDVIGQLLSGSMGELEDDKVEEDYGADFGPSDSRHPGDVRRAIFLDAMFNTLENSAGTREWFLHNVVEEYWAAPSEASFTTLQAAIAIRRLNVFCRLSINLLKPFVTSPSPNVTSPILQSRSPSSSSSSSSLNTFDLRFNDTGLPTKIASLLQSRVILETEALDHETELDGNAILDSRCHVLRVLLEISRLNVDAPRSTFGNPREDVFGGTSSRGTGHPEGELAQLVGWAVATLAGWYRAGNALPWRAVLEKTLHQVVTGDWQASIAILSALLKHIPDDIKRSVFLSIFPMLNDQLVENPPPYPCPELSSFLTSLSKALPPLFFRPLFVCANSDQEVVVVNHLCTIQVHAKYVKDYWIRDIEMLCIALLSDIGNAEATSAEGGRGVARLGQLVLLVELIGKMQSIRHEKDAAGNGSDGRFIESIRFVTALETRMFQTIEVKERKTMLPSSQRMVLCMLFREFRLLTRSLKPALWLSPAVHWFGVFCADEHIGELEQEVTDSVERVQGLYMAAQEGVQQTHKRHTSMLAASVWKSVSTESYNDTKPLDLAATFVEHRKLIDSLSKGYMSKATKLFVALSALITDEDYQRLGPILWQHCLLDNVDTSSTASACFLLMQCAEKSPIDLLPAIEVDLHASDDTTRLEAVRKISVLVNWRFQLITQNFITDRTHRPFKLARPPLPFIAADIGTSLYVHVEDINENKDKDEVPLELKKRLAELGWAEDDFGVVDPRQEWIKTPLSILPPSQMERLEVGTGDISYGPVPLSPQPSPQPSPRRQRNLSDQGHHLQPAEEVATLLRRNSSSGGPVSGIKRRAVFVPTLSLIFPQLTKMVFDSNFTVASAARTTVLDLMRNDPALLARPILDHLAGDNKDPKLAISSFTALLHVRRILPPPLTHYIFNNLAGFLKLAQRQVEMPETLEDFGQVIPVMSSFAMQVSGMSMREIRRSKLEYLLIPSGSLWFPASAPKGPMFPRNIGESDNPFEPLPPRLISITMVRVSQNMFFLSALKRNYQDVQVIRKNMARLVLPSLEDQNYAKNLELRDYMPRKGMPDTRPPMKNGTVEILSLMISRSYILLVAQIFRSMPRHLSDRHELAILVDGLNRTLLAHGDDINVVSQVLIALMVASTRFRRLFMTGGGYTLFMPALVKVYAEKPSHPGIRSAIEYTANRFYALHKEAFLYQTINTIGQVAMLPDLEIEWFSKGVFDLLSSLRKGTANSAADMGGIHNANRAEEREALILHTADETPQTFLSAVRRVESQTGFQMAFQLPDEYETNRLSMDDFVRLCLTVIAHDLTIARAQHFLRLLRFLTPHLYNASPSTRTVLSDGISALGHILTKAFAKPKGGGEMPKPLPEEEDDSFLPPDPVSEKLSKEKTKIPSDSKIMRLDYLRLVLSFGLSGGQVSLAVARQAIDVTKSLLKDWTEVSFDLLATFLGDFVKMLLNREEAPAPKAIVAFLQEIAPVLHAYMVVDFTGVFETVLKLTQIPIYASDLAFSQVVVGEICTAGLANCDLAASENRIMTLQCRPIIISLLAEAIFLHDVDIIGVLEKRPPTHLFLAGVILPLTIAMKTEAQIIADGQRTDSHRRALANAWVRLLFYAMSACQKSRRDDDNVRNAFKGITGSFRSKSSDNRKQEGAFWRSHLPTFMTALQVIKVVVIRGSDDISSLPRLGVWERLTTFFRSMLAEGSAEFALRPEVSSTTTTPTGSPRTSSQFEPSTSNPGSNLFVSTSSDLNRPISALSSGSAKMLSRPRLIDYSLWSMLEFVCAYRSPLRMQLKLLTVEKIIALDEELQHLQQGTKTASSMGSNPYPSSPSSRRISSSPFNKNRKRTSALGLPSPDSSPYLMPSPSTLMPSPSLLVLPPTDVRRPGYAISPISPHDRPPGAPKIVHLGPSSASGFPPISSPMIGAGFRNSRIGSPSRQNSGDGVGGPSLTRATKIRSVKLIQETYRRIRGVQAFMGYSILLPLPGSGLAISSRDKDETEDATLETWTRSEALNAILKETKDLLEEFEESFGLDDEESVMVEVEQSRPLSATT